MSQNHPYQHLPIPSSAPFELKPSPGKGWGAFAIRRIASGTLIFKENPLFTIRKHHDHITEADVQSAVGKLNPEEKHQFSYLRDHASQPFTRLNEAFAENSFAISDDAHAHGLFPILSRFNHSCIPNAKVPDNQQEGDTTSIFAVRNIDVGDEITFCYYANLAARTRSFRHLQLRFTCNCKACLPGPYQRISDLRRTLLRGLQYLTIGVDVDGQKQPSALSIISDSKLKIAAEEYRIPLSSRLVYDLLIMALLEDEGLLDKFMVERLQPNIMMMRTWFQSQSNKSVVKEAMARKTWIQRFLVAIKIYGKEDAADYQISMMLRQMKGLS